jgi:hypothetical protein
VSRFATGPRSPSPAGLLRVGCCRRSAVLCRAWAAPSQSLPPGRRHVSGELQSRLYVKCLAGLVSGLAFTHTCTHARISMHGAASTRSLVRVMVRRWSRMHRLHAQCHRHTVLDRHPSQPRDPLNTLTARQWAKHRPTASRAVCSFTTTPTLRWTPPQLQRRAHNGAGAGVTRSTRTVRGSGSLAWERRGGIE